MSPRPPGTAGASCTKDRPLSRDVLGVGSITALALVRSIFTSLSIQSSRYPADFPSCTFSPTWRRRKPRPAGPAKALELGGRCRAAVVSSRCKSPNEKTPSGNCHLCFTHPVPLISGRVIVMLFVTVLRSGRVIGYCSIAIPRSFCMLGDISWRGSLGLYFMGF